MLKEMKTTSNFLIKVKSEEDNKILDLLEGV